MSLIIDFNASGFPQVKSAFKFPSAPFLHPRELPEEHRETASSIQDYLFIMSLSGHQLAAAISLFQYCRLAKENGDQTGVIGIPLFADWEHIAARDGAFSIYNFDEALAKTRSLIGKIPQWLQLIDTDQLKESEKVLDAAFPFARKMRDSVAHPELYANPTKKMGISDGSSSITINGGLFNETYVSTFKGEAVQYALDESTLNTIMDVAAQAFIAFEGLDPNIGARMPER